MPRLPHEPHPDTRRIFISHPPLAPGSIKYSILGVGGGVRIRGCLQRRPRRYSCRPTEREPTSLARGRWRLGNERLSAILLGQILLYRASRWPGQLVCCSLLNARADLIFCRPFRTLSSGFNVCHLKIRRPSPTRSQAVLAYLTFIPSLYLLGAVWIVWRRLPARSHRCSW